MNTLTVRNGTVIFLVIVLCMAASFVISVYMLPARASEKVRLGEEVAVVSLASGDAWSGVGEQGGLTNQVKGPWCIYAVIHSNGDVDVRYVEFLSPNAQQVLHINSNVFRYGDLY